MKKVIKIEGMRCGHCMRHVEEALNEVASVSSVDVSLNEKQAVVVGEQLDDAILTAAIVEVGYQVVSIQDAQ
ncbi:MAG: heavy-metal-associated domain-containing protein [Erysipelotrichaceae bacterium]